MRPTTEALERAALGAVMKQPALLSELVADYPREMWHTPQLASLLQLMVTRQQEGLSIEPEPLVEALYRYGEARAAAGNPIVWGQDLPGLGDVMALPDHAPSVEALGSWVAELRDSYGFRLLTELQRDLPGLVSADSRPMEVVGSIAARLEKVAASAKQSNRQSVGTIALDVVDDLHSEAGADHDAGIIPFGIAPLDDVLGGGVRRKELVAIGGRPGDGKTTLARQLAWNATLDGRSVLALSAEMDRKTWVRLDLARWAGIPAWRLRQGAFKLSAAELGRLKQAAEEMGSARYDVDDIAGPSLEHARQVARRFALEQGGLDLLVVDYLQIMGIDLQQHGRRLDALNAFVDGLRRLAKEYDCAVVVLSQLNRESEQAKIPRLGNLKEAGGLEDAAHLVLFPWRQGEAEGECRRQDIWIRKNRHGARDVSVSVQLDVDSLCFVESEDAFGI